MPPSNLQHRRTHNLLLIFKLLNQRDTTSPFTLVLDSLEQSARPLIDKYIRRAKLANLRIVFVSFSTLRRPRDVDIFLAAWKHEASDVHTWHGEVLATLHTQPKEKNQKTLLIIDSLHPLSSTSPSLLPSFLSSFLSPTTSLLAVYHTDIPLPHTLSTYAPSPLTLLRYLATTLWTTYNLAQVLAGRRAHSRSLEAPSFGLREGVEGVLQGLAVQGGGGGKAGERGVVLELEHRRKSGRGVREWYFLPTLSSSSSSSSSGQVILLEDHAVYASLGREEGDDDAGVEDGAERTTFSLGLTERQRRDREGVVLPYFDAQKGEGAGDGGRILYDMGSEDDFDEEEDEI